MVDRNGDRGFTLIEVLTAMIILTISMVTIFHLFSDGLKSVKISTGYTRAIFLARAKMEDVLLTDSLREGETEGIIEEGYRWRLNIVPAKKGEGSSGQSNPLVKLFLVSVDVIWDNGGHEKTFSIRTMHLAAGIAEDENA